MSSQTRKEMAMTRNQIAYLGNLEDARHNQVVEVETNRANLVNESIKRAQNKETKRSNRANEKIRRKELKETKRSHKVGEKETHRHNVATESNDYIKAIASKTSSVAAIEQAKAAGKQADAAKQNADTNARNLSISQQNADANTKNAASNAKNAKTNAKGQASQDKVNKQTIKKMQDDILTNAAKREQYASEVNKNNADAMLKQAQTQYTKAKEDYTRFSILKGGADIARDLQKEMREWAKFGESIASKYGLMDKFHQMTWN